MPEIRVNAPSAAHASEIENASKSASNPLPGLLRTPLGLAVLEIQGKLNLPTHVTDPSPVEHTESMPGSGEGTFGPPIGRLVFPLLTSPLHMPGDNTTATEGPWMKKVHLYIGRNQRLVGEVRKLPKPLGVLRRRKCSVNANSHLDDVEMPDADMDRVTPQQINATVSNGEELEIADVVRYKLFFGGRPEFV